jgi:dTDP-4-dehydrorhamnose reductase
MKIILFGAGGMLGRDVVRAAEAANHEVVPVPHAEVDITDAPAVDLSVKGAAPAVVVNCAAYTDVDGAEAEEGEALRVNAEGARNVASAAAAAGATVVYPSTDYVFDGAKPEPYAESDEPRPLSAYGRSKLAGEVETAVGNPRHHVVRSSWLFGTGGRNFVETMLSLARERGQVVVVRDQVGSPTYAGHLAAGLVQLLDSHAYGLRHMAGAGDCSWYEFALEIFKQAGVECHVLSCTTDEFPRPAPRPAHSVLTSELDGAIELPHWREGLRSYLAERPVPA